MRGNWFENINKSRKSFDTFWNENIEKWKSILKSTPKGTRAGHSFNIDTSKFFDILNKELLALPNFDTNLLSIFKNPVSANKFEVGFSQTNILKFICKNPDGLTNLQFTHPDYHQKVELTLKDLDTFPVDMFIEWILYPLIFKHSFFIPAERIGIMLHIHNSTKVEQVYSPKYISNLDLARRTFIQEILNYSRDSGKTSNTISKGKIKEKIEKIIDTRIIVKHGSKPEFFFLRNTDGIADELTNTSSMNVSFAPLLLYLQYANIKTLDEINIEEINEGLGNQIIIEEPESHLHPKAQREIAELYVMLVNLGIEVLLITHSPYIVDHINNLIEANKICKKYPEKKEEITKWIPEDAFIDSNKVSAYYFGKDPKSPQTKFVINDAMEEGLIRWDTFGQVGDELERIGSELINIEYEAEKHKKSSEIED